VLGVLDTFLRTESEALTFATLSVLVISPDRRAGTLLMAGHPPPLVLGDTVAVLGDGHYGHLLGVMPEPSWTPVPVVLGAGAALLLYTDGLIEGRAEPESTERLGLEALVELAAQLAGKRLTGTDLLDALLTEVQRRNGGPLADDVALCLVSIPAGAPGGA
jgi:serine phosphatase RsbU (regulator of sigma subunit)